MNGRKKSRSISRSNYRHFLTHLFPSIARKIKISHPDIHQTETSEFFESDEGVCIFGLR